MGYAIKWWLGLLISNKTLCIVPFDTPGINENLQKTRAEPKYNKDSSAA